ncbi:MAG: subclass B1 metallo-beta-lactamase, partial [Fulvivirga sp.]|nr:subclass B1 metallo-beta-lactamase [Fulvivirga sp.]
ESFIAYEGSKVGANGLIIETSDSVIVVDTPWNNEQTRKLINWVREHIKKPISFFVITHAHDDRIGGISLLKKEQIRSISGMLTAKAAIEAEFAQPDIIFEKDTLIEVNQMRLEIFYPGPGHTKDNVVVYVHSVDVLYGGCFLKNATTKSLGNIADADLNQWPLSVRSMKSKFPDARIVIPGHGNLGSGAIENTLKLLEQRAASHN